MSPPFRVFIPLTIRKRKAAEEVRRVLSGQAPSYQVNKF